MDILDIAKFALPEEQQSNFDKLPQQLRYIYSEYIRKKIQTSIVGDHLQSRLFPNLVQILQLENGSRISMIDFPSTGGTSKDVVAYHMLHSAERKGIISPSTTPNLVIGSSGNAAISLSENAIPRGYNIISVLPDSVDHHRFLKLEMLRANVHPVCIADGFYRVYDKAKKLAKEIPHSILLDQTMSNDNYKGFLGIGAASAINHFIQSGQYPTHIVAGVGTGGTGRGLSEGIRRALQYTNSQCQYVAVEIAEDPFLSKKYPQAILHNENYTLSCIQSHTTYDNWWTEPSNKAIITGLNANIDGPNLTQPFEDGSNSAIAHVSNHASYLAQRLLFQKYKYGMSPSTGAAFAEALCIAEQNSNANIIIPGCESSSMNPTELSYPQKWSIKEITKTHNKVGSSLELHTNIYADMRTNHLNIKRMGGPFSTTALIGLIEEAGRELDKVCGLVTFDKDSFGDSIYLKHEGSILMEANIKIEIKMINIEGRKITYEYCAYVKNKNNWEKFTNTAKHTRVIANPNTIIKMGKRGL